MLHVLVTTSFILDIRRTKKNSKNPVKLCVNAGHKSKYYTTGIDMRVEEYVGI